MDEPLREGTSAVIRQTSLSGVANRYIALTPGPNNDGRPRAGRRRSAARTRPPRSTSTSSSTSSADRERRALQKFIEGNATVYAGKQRARQPRLQVPQPGAEHLRAAVRRALQRLGRAAALPRRRLADVLGDRRPPRRPDLADHERERDAAGDRRTATPTSTARSPRLPQTLRQANTTFVNLRAALDDLDPLVAASKPATKNLAPFLRRTADHGRRGLRPGLQRPLRRRQPARRQQRPRRHAQGAARASATRAAPRCPPRSTRWTPRRTTSTTFRPYTPDLLGFLGNFGARSPPTTTPTATTRASTRPREHLRLPTNGAAPDTLDPIYTDPAAQYDDITFELFRALPGRRRPDRGRRLQPVPRRRRPRRRRLRPRRRAPEPMRRIVLILGGFVALAALAGHHRRRRGRGRRQTTWSAPTSTTPASSSRARTSGSPARRWAASRRSTSPAPARPSPRTATRTPARPSVTMSIDDPGFQDFRADASCLIRPQSLLGEKFVDCDPTQPRAPGSEPPPAARADPRRRDRRGPVPPAAREQRQGRRPRPRQQHHPRARGRPLPADPQRPRRRPRRPRRGPRRGAAARQPGPAADRPGARHARRSRTTSSPSSPPTPTRS